MNQLDTFTRAYIEAALWSSTDNADERGGEPLDANYGLEDVAPETLERMVADCADFQLAQAKLLALAGDDAQNGHDFWLTRNRHGAGFWDRGYPPHIGHVLADAAHVYGGIDLYVGNDGKVRS